MSNVDGSVKSLELFDPGSYLSVPEEITELYFWKFGYNHILGEGRYFHHVDDLYGHFLETMRNDPGFRDDLYDKFCFTYNKLNKAVNSKKQIEYKIQDIINKTDTVVLFVKDHFRVDLLNSWMNPVPELSEYFSNMCDYYYNKKFVLVTSLENLDKEINKPNCTVISMGGDVTNQIHRFNEYKPANQKIVTPKHSISLNRGVRNHRTYLVSYLYGLGLDEHTKISYLGMNRTTGNTLHDYLRYYRSEDPNLRTVEIGFSRFIETDKAYDDPNIYKETTPNDNIYNFNHSLRDKYNTSFLEFVTETNYNEVSFNVTEKFVHSVFGYNIPIIVSSPGYVEFLRTVGFDVFDDIVDHSYDTELDKLTRLHTLVSNNIDLLTSSRLPREFENNKARLTRNCEIATNHLPVFYHNRFWEQVRKL
jgi:hypothetical protein